MFRNKAVVEFSVFNFNSNDLTADTDLLKMVPVEILLNFGNYFLTLQSGFCKFLFEIVFLHYYVRTIGPFFLQDHSI